MKTRILAILTLICAATFLIHAAYTWYFTDNFPGGVVNSTNWQLNNSPYQSGKMAISKLAIPDGSADHEVRTTLPATCPGTRQYLQLLRATNDYDDNWTGSAYRVEVRVDPPTSSCLTSIRISKVTTATGWTQ